LVDIPEAAASGGPRVSVIQVATRTEHVTRNGIDYHFLGIDASVDRGSSFARLLSHIKANVVHVHGLDFAEDAFAVSQCLPRLPILFQDHANRTPRWWRRSRWRQWYSVASGVTFTAPELARPFIDADLFGAQARVFSIPESSSRFTMGSRERARAETGIYGDPCVLSVGHLSQGKDPLTVIDGVAQAALQLPGLQLWCAFGDAPLFHEVQRRIERYPQLAGRVHLLGKVPHARIEPLMRAADLFVSGSRNESCGYAVLEALACGVTPVVTDIPSFRALTGGYVGHLWPTGNAARLAEALVSSAQNRPSPERVRAHFDAALSFAAVGRKWAEAYAQVYHDRRRRTQ
jgi:glycosyltransferase involved in cell wall biosynthesis